MPTPEENGFQKKLPQCFWGVITPICALIIGFLDWITAYEMDFFVFYFLPVAAAAWYLEFSGAVCLSVLSAVVWYIADVLTGHVYSSRFYDVWAIMIHLTAFLVIGWCFSKIANLLRHEQKLLNTERALLYRERELSDELRRSVSEINLLESFLSICSQCKKIRNEKGGWQALETYIGEHTATRFSHGYCPDCTRKVLDEMK